MNLRRIGPKNWIEFSLGLMSAWNKAVVFGSISAGTILAIYVAPSPEGGHSAGANFAYNIIFFAPAMVVSFIFWGFGLDSYLSFLRGRSGASRLKVATPAVLLLPFAVQAAWIVFMLILLFVMMHA